MENKEIKRVVTEWLEGWEESFKKDNIDGDKKFHSFNLEADYGKDTCL